VGEVVAIGGFVEDFVGVVSFVDRAFADGASDERVVFLLFLGETGLAVGGGLG
jgi:hypothetical protein